MEIKRVKVKTNAKKSNREYVLILVDFVTKEAIVNGKYASAPFITVTDGNGNLVNQPEEYSAHLTYMRGSNFFDNDVKFNSKKEGNEFFKNLRKEFPGMEVIK